MLLLSRPRLLPALALAGLLAAGGLGPPGAAAHDAAPGEAVVPLSFTAADPSGARVYHVSNPFGFGIVRYWVNGTMSHDYNPWHVQVILEDGTVFPFYRVGLTADFDLAPQGAGDGVAYAGGPGSGAQTPAVRDPEEPLRIAWRDAVPGTSGRVVVAWANQRDPLSFDLHWPAGTLVELVAEAPLRAYELKDFRGGARAGAPAAVVANVGDSLTFEPDDAQLWGYFFVWRSTAFGHGRLAVERAGDGLRREMSFDSTAVTAWCVCFEWHRWAFTSSSRMDARLDLVSDGQRTAVFAVVAHLPPATLPEDVWREFDDTVRPPR